MNMHQILHGGTRTWCSHMLVRMKNSSMKTAPKGRMPPMSTLKAGCMYHACSGTCRGILLVRTGSCRVGCCQGTSCKCATMSGSWIVVSACRGCQHLE